MRTSRRGLVWWLLAALAAPACTGDRPGRDGSFRLEGLAVGTVVVGEPPPGGRAALYMEMANRADTPVVLTGVELPGGGRAGLHASLEEGGRRIMRPVDSVVVPPGGSVRLEPGGLHVMIREIPGRPVPGDSLAALLRFRGGGWLEVEARVVPLAELEGLFSQESGESSR